MPVYKIPLIVIMLFGSTAYCQHKTIVSENTELHPNGELKVHIIVTSKISKDPKLYEYYWKKSIERFTYDTSGTLLTEMFRVELHSSYGRPCDELIYKFVEYNSNGDKVWEFVSKCDCKREKYIRYHDGKKIIKQKKRRYTWKY